MPTESDSQITEVFGSDCFRFVDQAVAQYLQEMLDHAFTKLNAMFDLNTEKPQLVCVRSHIAKPLLLFFPGRRSTLVFDQHLLDVSLFAAQSRLSAITKRETGRALLRLYSERLYRAGRFPDACIMVRSAALNLVNDSKSRTGSVDITVPLLDAFNQQRAIIAHELAHAVLRQLQGQELSEMERGYIDTVRPVFEETNAFINVTETEEIGFSSPTDMLERVAADPVLLEECICDSLALLASLPGAVDDASEITPTAVGLVHSLQTMQTLHLMDHVVSATPAFSEISLREPIAQGVARTFCFHAFAVHMTRRHFAGGAGEIPHTNEINHKLYEAQMSSLPRVLATSVRLADLENYLRGSGTAEAGFGHMTRRQVRDYLSLHIVPTSYLDPTPTERLRQLAELRDAEMVTPEEFEAKRAELLRRI